MIRPDFAQWNQTSDHILRLSIETEHPPSRELLQMFDIIETVPINAARWIQEISPQNETLPPPV